MLARPALLVKLFCGPTTCVVPTTTADQSATQPYQLNNKNWKSYNMASTNWCIPDMETLL